MLGISKTLTYIRYFQIQGALQNFTARLEAGQSESCQATDIKIQRHHRTSWCDLLHNISDNNSSSHPYNVTNFFCLAESYIAQWHAGLVSTLWSTLFLAILVSLMRWLFMYLIWIWVYLPATGLVLLVSLIW